tara:strand:- start:5724 stop:6425 length:702 start_codon:yes stop_codon:yes gene_type:complete
VSNIQNFETYLFISLKKIIILVNNDTKKVVYENKVTLEQNSKHSVFDELDFFLNENVFKIEKVLDSFIKKINIIIDLDQFIPIQISIKGKNFENLIDHKNLNHLLYEAKDICKDTIDNKKIIHMLINNYKIDNNNFQEIPKNINGKTFSLDVEFICASKSLIENIEKILKKYHIFIEKIVSAKYVERFLDENEKNIFLMTKKIIDGHNKNEVELIKKTIKNKGFFEKFFNFFN